jgi:GAF domain-containing protein
MPLRARFIQCTLLLSGNSQENIRKKYPGGKIAHHPRNHAEGKNALAFYRKKLYSIFVGLLYDLTFAINFLGLVLALWLGLYLVTRNPRYLIAWLAALTLWSMSGLFFNVLLAINPPPLPVYYQTWLRFMFPFWSEAALLGNPNIWLLGWSVAPAVAFWHHATILMRPGRLNAWRWSRILIGYLMAFLAIIAQANGSLLYTEKESNPLFLNSLHAGTWFPIFGIALLLLTWSSVVNLFRSAQDTPASMPHKQLMLLASATLVAGLIAPVAMIGSILGAPVPMLVMSLLLVIPVSIMGYGVARYSAAAAGRTIQRDFGYNLVLLAVVSLIYLIASLFLVKVYGAPGVTIVFVPVLAVFTHSLTSTAYGLLDSLFYRRETRQLRSNLRQLIQLAGEGEALEESMGHTLDALCSPVSATYGLILTYDEQVVRLLASYRWKNGTVSLPTSYLAADDITHLEPGQFPAPLDEAALLVPLYSESSQLGALLLGRPTNGIRYRDDEVERIMSMADLIGDAIYSAQRQSLNIRQIAQLAQTQQQITTTEKQAIVPVEAVENALRNLYDFAYLGDSTLGELQLVRTRLTQGQMTTLDKGKMVHEVLLEAVNKLRPLTEIARDPPPREWHPYLILREAYLEEKSNRDIMLKLYISEGTFNRTRRAAVRSVARTLGEMEETLV